MILTNDEFKRVSEFYQTSKHTETLTPISPSSTPIDDSLYLEANLTV